MENLQILEQETNNRLTKSEACTEDRDKIFCPLCKKEVSLIDFGEGWVGVCCGKLVYSSCTKKFK